MVMGSPLCRSREKPENLEKNGKRARKTESLERRKAG
jgi:hypothetical protein